MDEQQDRAHRPDRGRDRPRSTRAFGHSGNGGCRAALAGLARLRGGGARVRCGRRARDEGGNEHPARDSDSDVPAPGRFVTAGAPESGSEKEADARTRTGDPFITSEVLYQLSYVGSVGLV